MRRSSDLSRKSVQVFSPLGTPPSSIRTVRDSTVEYRPIHIIPTIHVHTLPTASSHTRGRDVIVVDTTAEGACSTLCLQLREDRARACLLAQCLIDRSPNEPIRRGSRGDLLHPLRPPGRALLAHPSPFAGASSLESRAALDSVSATTPLFPSRPSPHLHLLPHIHAPRPDP